MNRSVKLLFVVSLLLNLLLAGIIGGHVWWHVNADRPWADISAAVLPLMPPEKQKVIADELQKIRTEADSLHEKVAAARENTIKLLKSEPFDKAAYLAATTQFQQLRDQMNQKMNNDIADMAADMSPAERTALANAMHNAPFGGPHGPDDKSHPHPVN